MALDASQGDGDHSEPEVSAACYANDVVLTSYDPDRSQSGLELFVELFEWAGLKTNLAKTKAMVCLSDCACGHLSSAAFKCCFEGGPTCAARKRQRSNAMSVGERCKNATCLTICSMHMMSVLMPVRLEVLLFLLAELLLIMRSACRTGACQ
jgi:hypothetical protein